MIPKSLLRARSAHLNRQSEVYAREGIDLDVSTLADWVGAAAATLMPLNEAIRTHVFAAERIHADDTTVPVLAKGKTRTGRLWTYVRDDRPFGGRDPPATIFFYSADRGGEHPEQHLASYAGLMQADAYAGFKRLYDSRRKAGAIIEAACWAHARRKFFDIARINKAPIAIEAVKRIDALFALTRFLDDGRLCMSSNAVAHTFCAAETRLPGWACRIRTSESVRELSIWICVTTLPEGSASPAAETLRVRAV